PGLLGLSGWPGLLGLSGWPGLLGLSGWPGLLGLSGWPGLLGWPGLRGLLRLLRLPELLGLPVRGRGEPLGGCRRIVARGLSGAGRHVRAVPVVPAACGR
ncbi:hypothetical protein ABZV14_03125, partial [Streptosporangium canum]|uniref:hypothetical protein n=1 Tax=Streptosporangium canum TaxID=324952 RepID=UPI0033ACA37D